MQRLKQLFMASRPISWINTAYPFAAGYIVFTGRIDLTLVIGTIYFLTVYNLLMYGINDIYDYESDIRNPRKGGIEGAKVSRSFHRTLFWTAILSNIPFLIALLALGSLTSGLVLVAVVFFVLAYSLPKLRFKERPFIDSITSSLHFVGPLLFAVAITGFTDHIWPIIIAFFLWGMASHAFGAVQDIIADREGGIGSIATVLGARRTVWLTLFLYVTAAMLVALQGGYSIAVGVAGMLYAANVVPFLGITDASAETANRGWRRFIWLNLFAGFVVTMVLILNALT